MNPDRDRRLRHELSDLPELGALAATTLPGEHLGGDGGSRSVPSSRPPLSIPAATLTTLRDAPYDVLDWPIRHGGIVWTDARGHIHTDDGLPGSILTVLASWTRWIDAEIRTARDTSTYWPWTDPTPLADTPTVTSETAWLLRHIVWILDQEWADELASDIHRLTQECRQVLRIRPTYRPHCPREGCGGILREESTTLWRCDMCDHPAGDQTKLGLRTVVAQQQPMTAAQIAKGFGINFNTLRAWVSRGHLTPVDDTQRPSRYHPLEVLRLADERGVALPVGDAMTLAEIAERVGVPVKTLHDWHAKGRITPLSGGHVRRERLFSLGSVASAARDMGRVS